MRKAIYWVFRIIVLIVAIKFALWMYQNYWVTDRAGSKPIEVSEIDKLCILDGDSGQCICRHRRTREWLPIPYDECVSRARNP